MCCTACSTRHNHGSSQLGRTVAYTYTQTCISDCFVAQCARKNTPGIFATPLYLHRPHPVAQLYSAEEWYSDRWSAQLEWTRAQRFHGCVALVTHAPYTQAGHLRTAISSAAELGYARPTQQKQRASPRPSPQHGCRAARASSRIPLPLLGCSSRLVRGCL